MAGSEDFLSCLDIWNEILKYFEVSLDNDEEHAVKEKRKTTLVLALLSSKLTELSLNTLWRNMSTLEPIVAVINSRLDDEETFLDYSVTDGRSYWVCKVFFLLT